MTSDALTSLPGMIGSHPAMLDVYRRVRKIAVTDLPLLIVGETGTGKELVARAAHALSGRSSHAFVAVNCAAIPESLAEAELFGAEAGAYTGAVRRRDGLLHRAAGGTLFLDELCSMPLTVQAKVLRVVEDQIYHRLGGDVVLRSDFRLVAAVSRDPSILLADNLLRRDLFHRLAQCRVSLPPLRDRGHDVVLLAEAFLNGTGKHLSPSGHRYLLDQNWSGNVRELRGVLQSAVAMADGYELTADDLTTELNGTGAVEGEAERLFRALEQHKWNVSAAAKTLGYGRTRFYELMREHALMARRPVTGLARRSFG